MAACSRKQSSFPASGTSRDWNDSQKMKRFLPASRVNCMHRRLQACFLTWHFSRKGNCSNDFSFLPLQFKLTQKKKRENQFSFPLSCLFRHLGFIYTRKNSRALAEALGCDCWHSPWHSAGSCQPAAPRDFPATVLGTAVPPTAPKWQFEHHQFVLGGRKLRYKDMGSVRSLASGHIRIFDPFCLNLARESSASASKLPALSCWRQIPRGTGEKHRSGKTSWFCKPWNLQNQVRKRGSWLGRVFTKLLCHIYFTFYVVLCFT